MPPRVIVTKSSCKGRRHHHHHTHPFRHHRPRPRPRRDGREATAACRTRQPARSRCSSFVSRWHSLGYTSSPGARAASLSSESLVPGSRAALNGPKRATAWRPRRAYFPPARAPTELGRGQGENAVETASGPRPRASLLLPLPRRPASAQSPREPSWNERAAPPSRVPQRGGRRAVLLLVRWGEVPQVAAYLRGRPPPLPAWLDLSRSARARGSRTANARVRLALRRRARRATRGTRRAAREERRARRSQGSTCWTGARE